MEVGTLEAGLHCHRRRTTRTGTNRQLRQAPPSALCFAMLACFTPTTLRHRPLPLLLALFLHARSGSPRRLIGIYLRDAVDELRLEIGSHALARLGRLRHQNMT